MSGEGITTRIEDDIRIQIFVQSEWCNFLNRSLCTGHHTLSYWWDHTHIVHVHQNSDIMSCSERIRDLLIQMCRECIAPATYGLPQSCYYRCLNVHLAGMKKSYLKSYIYQQFSIISKISRYKVTPRQWAEVFWLWDRHTLDHVMKTVMTAFKRQSRW